MVIGVSSEKILQLNRPYTGGYVSKTIYILGVSLSQRRSREKIVKLKGASSSGSGPVCWQLSGDNTCGGGYTTRKNNKTVSVRSSLSHILRF